MTTRRHLTQNNPERPPDEQSWRKVRYHWLHRQANQTQVRANQSAAISCSRCKSSSGAIYLLVPAPKFVLRFTVVAHSHTHTTHFKSTVTRAIHQCVYLKNCDTFVWHRPHTKWKDQSLWAWCDPATCRVIIRNDSELDRNMRWCRNPSALF